MTRKTREEKILDVAMDYKKTFSTDHGARVLADIVQRSFMLQPTDVGKGHDRMLLNEGRRELGLLIYGAANKDMQDLKQIIDAINRDRQSATE